MNTETVARLLLLLAATLLGAGCASGPRMDVIETGETLALVGVPDAEPMTVAVGNDSIRNDAATGAGAGLMTGLMAGTTCGPWVLVCAPAAGLTMAVVGGTGGAIVGAARGMNSADREAAIEQLRRELDRENADEAFRRRIAEQIQDRWTIVSGESENQVGVAIVEVSIRGEGGNSATLRVRADAFAQSCVSCAGSRRMTASFVRSSEPFSVEHWIANDYDFVRSELHRLYGQILPKRHEYLYVGGGNGDEERERERERERVAR